jgi:long-subunit fatty acid transport protein
MKKITTIAAMLGLGCLGAFEMPKVDVNTSVGFDTEYVYRGVKRGQQAFLPKAEMSAAVFEGAKLYVGAEAALPLKDIKDEDVSYSWTRTDLYIGMTYSINEMFTVDAGYDHYFYTNLKDSDFKTDANEVYVGVMADVIASPSIYVTYDFNCREFAVEGKVGYTLDLGQFGLNNFAADFSGKAGFDYAQRPFGIKDLHQASHDDTKGDKDYFYYGVGADLVYSLTDSAKLRAGVAYEGNSAKKDSFINTISCFDAKEGHNNMIFFRSSVDCAF